MKILKLHEHINYMKLPHGENIYHTDPDAMPFFYHNGKLYVGDNGTTHTYMEQSVLGCDGNKLDYVGRLWCEKCAISFDSKLNDVDLIKVCQDLKDNFSIIIDNDWLLEFKIGKKAFLTPVEDFYAGNILFTYDNDGNIVNNWKMHTMTPIEKEEEEKKGNIKRHRYYKSKPLAYKYSMHQENKNR